MTAIDTRPSRAAVPVWLLACGLALVVITLFGTAVGFGFLNWDDPQNVLENPNVNRPSWQGAWSSWRAPYWGMYVPVSYTVLACEAAVAQRVDPHSGLSELRPSVFHLGNLLLHVASALVAFLLLRRLLDALAGDQAANIGSAGGRSAAVDLAAALGALFFAVHPLQVESVAWISEVRGLLCGLFALLTLWLYVEYADARRSIGLRSMAYAGATAALIAALLSKPVAVAVPLMAGVVGVGILRRRPAGVLLEVAPWIVCAAAASAIAKHLQPDRGAALAPSLAARPLVALDAISFYVGKLFMPLHLAADYSRTPQVVLGGRAFQIGWVLLPALAIGLALLKPRRVPLLGFALFLAWLVPVLGLIAFDFQRISTVADRYAYLAMLGPALVLAWIVQRWWGRPVVAVAAVVVELLAAASFLQLGAWRDTRTLFTRTLAVNPRSAVANYHLGYLAFLEGDRDEAIRLYRKSLELRPDFVLTHVALARALFASGKLEAACRELRQTTASGADAKLVQTTLSAMESKQQCLVEASTEINRGVAEERAGRVAEARRHYLAAIQIQPGLAGAHYNLGNLAYAQRDWPQAVEHYRAALKFQPEYAQAHANLGAALLQLGQQREAIIQERAALIIDPNLLPARMTLGQAMLAAGQTEEAAAEFRQALGRISPGSPQAADVQAWLQKAESP